MNIRTRASPYVFRFRLYIYDTYTNTYLYMRINTFSVHTCKITFTFASLSLIVLLFANSLAPIVSMGS